MSKEENVMSKEENVMSKEENVMSKEENVMSKEENVMSKEENYYCKKCNKKYKTKKYLFNHEEKCNGLNILTCPKCMFTFTTRSSKSAHIKKNKCKEPNDNDNDNGNANANTNANDNENNKPNIYINGNNNITNNYIINNYNSERTDYIKFDDIIKLFLNSGDFIIPKYIEMKHFNDKCPENQNIKYERNRGCIIRENNRWKYTNIDYLANDLLNKNSNELRTIYNKEKERFENKIRNLELIEFIYSRLNYLDLSMDKHIFKNIKMEIKNIIKSTLLY